MYNAGLHRNVASQAPIVIHAESVLSSDATSLQEQRSSQQHILKSKLTSIVQKKPSTELLCNTVGQHSDAHRSQGVEVV